ncbi:MULTISPECIES: acylneuraminate cytidylyltransferase [unclassified Streptomyces]|uniref:acylneuraminate cytidylyltransferase n=1 Tax=unclassified Streptomyces TaxID=2593676 RepID=UPI002ED2D416|nr:acylneuraminate cytidylyltransferase [Streptomyces sp. NBC_00891]WSY07361.1 acylneuraminate cytidylyltransferase [Streptomyces sp. NBC_00890]WSZ08986.1 acylneuraminate cytidylyltransferase [Streptomyces sp. NBC_00869]WSZ23515.1 acylneuraminate cytidylyltransferase [Streptomyces sp. NBC_00870]
MNRPTVLAVIPARGGSKGVPAKNLARVGGVPLVARAVRACLASGEVTDVVVTTDAPAVAEAARAAAEALGEGARLHCVQRPENIAGDTATSEAAVLHALDAYEAMRDRTADVVLLVQCTSPFLTREDIDGVAAAVAREGADTAVTVAPFHGFLWRDGTAVEDHNYGVNHDKRVRPRRQDRPEDLLETGAAYAMAAAGFRTHRHRFFGHTALVRTDPARVLEIDDPHDLARARALAPVVDPAPLPTRDDVDAVVLDFDGTQTDDRVLVDSDGRETVSVHRGDGLGIAALRKAGIPLLILSTEQNPVVAARAHKLRVPVLHGVDRKDLALKQWCDEQSLAPERVMYVGNDVNDLPCFALAGWPVAVASAHDSVRAAARAVTTTPGGSGAIREIAAWLLGPTLTTAPTQ